MLREISLSWFRGAAGSVLLQTKDKSLAVYGPNGSGKTSFVDGLEFLITGGRVAHLAHEYSGRRLERAIPNTHAPEGARATVRMVLHGNVVVSGSLGKEKAPVFDNQVAIAAWSLNTLILRQNQVAAFIQAEKSEKYSALLPIIGLGRLEIAAGDLAALAREIEKVSSLAANRGKVAVLQQQWERSFPRMTNAQIGARIKTSYRKYRPDAAEPAGFEEAVASLKETIAELMQRLEADQGKLALLRQAQQSGMALDIKDAVELAALAATRSEPLLAEKLGVIQSAAVYAEKLAPDGSFACPACGQDVEAGVFRAHVAKESSRLSGSLKHHADFRAARAKLATCLQSLRDALNARQLSEWRSTARLLEGGSELEAVLAVDPERLRSEVPGPALAALSASMPVAQGILDRAAAEASPELQELLNDRDAVEAASHHRELRSLRAAVARGDKVLAFVGAAEAQVRREIRARTASILSAISADVARMWAVLHPGEAIDGVHLYQNEGTEKAIDVAVCFHGKQQPSPRLTLSEGHRNSLGLCIFLALASREAGLPLVLDDVVTSFDREHRANVVDLLLAEFSDRQVLIFTHDEEWFHELTRRLPKAVWSFKSLLPESDPSTGIRWSASLPGFEAARALLDIDASSAANKARATMDLHLAVVCERLEVPMPFIRGVRNDKRTAGDLLCRLRARASDKLRLTDSSGVAIKHAVFLQATEELEALLVTWGNSGSHGRYVTRGEAERLVSSCERCLALLACTACKGNVWSERADKHLKCACGGLRWMS